MMTSQTPFPQKFMTLDRHIVEGEHSHPGATGEFSGLLTGLLLGKPGWLTFWARPIA
jgi:hypothetical protein